MPRYWSISNRLSRRLDVPSREYSQLQSASMGGLIGRILTEIEACKDTKIQHIFYLQPDAALNGLLNDAVTPTEYSDHYYNTLANSLWLGSIQIDGGGAWEGHIEIQHISTGHTDPNRTH
eukprot:scaffold8630_cov67-Skeletonema_dohrnii-CCMP3373.AAC.1